MNVFRRTQKVAKRSLTYVWKGYSLVSLPISLLAAASSIYYLAVSSNPVLQPFFPNFSDFLLIGIISVPTACGILGYIFYKRSPLFQAEQEINVETNPYASRKITPVLVPLYKAVAELCRKKEIATAELEEILERSQ